MSMIKQLMEINAELELMEATRPLKKGDPVTINGVNESNPDHEGRIDKIDKDFVYITNMNMPYAGSMVMKKFKKSDVTLVKNNG